MLNGWHLPQRRSESGGIVNKTGDNRQPAGTGGSPPDRLYDIAMEVTMKKPDISLAVQALWLQYQGLSVESARTLYRVENAAWKLSPPTEPEDPPAIAGLMVAT